MHTKDNNKDQQYSFSELNDNKVCTFRYTFLHYQAVTSIGVTLFTKRSQKLSLCNEKLLVEILNTFMSIRIPPFWVKSKYNFV